MPKISIEEFDAIIREELPWAEEVGMRTESIGKGEASLRLPFNNKTLRPGGTISGPTMMALCDVCMYAAIMSAIGREDMAVTCNFNINFMQLPAQADMIAEGSILKLGKRLAVMEVTVHSDGHDDPVAHATATFSLPPRKS